MFQASLQLAQTIGQSDHKFQAGRVAGQLYRRALLRGRLGQLWSAITGRSRHMLDLSALEAMRAVRGRHYVGVRAVPLSGIQGSEGRCQDFDRTFAPLEEHNAHRWLSVAAARLLGATLPPVELIQVEDVYYVRDGHHRVSVARAMGESEIDAVVTVWQVAELSISSQPATPSKLASQST